MREVRVQVHQGRKMLWGTDEKDVEVGLRWKVIGIRERLEIHVGEGLVPSRSLLAV